MTPARNGEGAGRPWTARDIPDLSGRTALVTGATSGVGFETARELARRGARVVIPCRRRKRGEAARARIRRESPAARIEVDLLDLASLASIRRFSDGFQDHHERLDLLIANAAAILAPYGQTDDGLERQFGINHLGHFALTGSLVALLLATPDARVVTVSSLAHRHGDTDFAGLLATRPKDYSRRRSYRCSKLANLLFTYELQRRLERRGAPTIATAAHPGICRTSLGRRLEDSLVYRVSFACLGLILQSAAMGALPTLRAATDPGARGGEYYGPGGRRERRGFPVLVESSDASRDVPAAERLWRLSEELTGVEYL